MKGQDRPSDGQFGFARGTLDRDSNASSSVRLAHPRDNTDQMGSSGGFHRPDQQAPEPISEAVAERWILRPKHHEDEVKRRSPFEMRASDIRMPSANEEEATAAEPPFTQDVGPRRWLALAFAGMIYIVGLAGLWSMMQSFDNAALLPVTPAGDEQPVPPIEETIDVRDASLDGILRPQFRPNDLRKPSDLATSNLQDRS